MAGANVLTLNNSLNLSKEVQSSLSSGLSCLPELLIKQAKPDSPEIFFTVSKHDLMLASLTTSEKVYFYFYIDKISQNLNEIKNNNIII